MCAHNFGGKTTFFLEEGLCAQTRGECGRVTDISDAQWQWEEKGILFGLVEFKGSPSPKPGTKKRGRNPLVASGTGSPPTEVASLSSRDSFRAGLQLPDLGAGLVPVGRALAAQLPRHAQLRVRQLLPGLAKRHRSAGGFPCPGIQTGDLSRENEDLFRRLGL